MFNKEYIAGEGSGITLTNNEIKGIMNIIKSLENRGILLKGTTEKVINQKVGFLSSLMRVGLALIKNVLTLFIKIFLLP